MTSPVLTQPSVMSEEEVLALLATPRPTGVPPFLGKFVGECRFPPHLEHLADFEGATFTKAASFANVTFKKGVSFIGTVFEEEADFREAIFEGPAFFWKCSFVKKANFDHSKILDVKHDESVRYPGEANFSYSRFKQEASFKRAQFGGPAYFHRTCFLREANFEECRFSRFVKFEGAESDICLAERDFPSVAFIKKMLDAGIITQSADHPPKQGNLGFYNLDPEITSAENLSDKMHLSYQASSHNFIYFKGTRRRIHPTFPVRKSDEKLTHEDRTVMEELRSKLALPMFSRENNCQAIFVRTQFLAGALFSELNLEQARFQQTTLTGVIFASVTWNQMPLAFGLGTRAALYDERRLVPAGFLEDTYHDLRIEYQKRGVGETSRDFYFGELELRYMSQGNLLDRVFSLAFLYRYFSGFGRQQGLAGAWLVLMVLFLFPALWVFVFWFEPISISHIPHLWPRFLAIFPKLAQVLRQGFTSSMRGQSARAIVRSLEACTFVARNQADYPGVEKILAGIERIVVFSQLTLFVLATKWQFERNPGSS
jgi:uncharacterized protein YjbI with pentapeptide repeats